MIKRYNAPARLLIGAIAVASLATVFTSASVRAATKSASMPVCKGRIVWVIAAKNPYYVKGNPQYGKPMRGTYMCEADARARGYRLATSRAIALHAKRRVTIPSAPATAVARSQPVAAYVTIAVVASNWKFTPGTITTHVGEQTTLSLTSAGGVHGLASTDLGIPLTAIAPRKSVSVRFRPNTAGTYKVHCAIVCGAGHANMILTIIVLP